jgi:hypothetical protein
MQFQCADLMCRFKVQIQCSALQQERTSKTHILKTCADLHVDLQWHAVWCRANFTAHPICIQMQQTFYCTSLMHINNASLIDYLVHVHPIP